MLVICVVFSDNLLSIDKGLNLSENFLLIKWRPGSNPIKHDFPDFIHICKIFFKI
jgi:hypothetical protein